jgi:hypothetical protein
MPGTSLEAITGRLGVGAVAFLGLFLMLDGAQLGAFELVETYGKSSTWGIVGVVPTLVVIHIIGVFCVGIAELGLSRFAALHGPEPRDILVVSRSGMGLLQQLYAEHLRNQELLKGAAVSFVILAIGSLAEWRTIPGTEIIVVLAAGGAILLSCLSLVFARRAVEQAAALAIVAEHETAHHLPAELARSGE